MHAAVALASFAEGLEADPYAALPLWTGDSHPCGDESNNLKVTIQSCSIADCIASCICFIIDCTGYAYCHSLSICAFCAWHAGMVFLLEAEISDSGLMATTAAKGKPLTCYHVSG
jgi:hypothetical protein